MEIKNEAKTQKDAFPIISEDKVKHLRSQFSKKNTYSCGYEGLHDLPIQGYANHHAGYEIGESTYWWLFVICPKCDYACSLPKLGVGRERY
jgi:hypothetical protein